MTIVLFYPEGEEYFNRIVLSGIEYKVFDPIKDVKHNLRDYAGALTRFVKSERLLIFQKLWSIKGIKLLLRKYRAQLVADQLRELKPTVVLTFIDNSNIFHLVCEICNEIPFLAVQNGGRHLWCATDALPAPELKYHIDEYFCFGSQVKDMFERYEHDIKKYHICGSLLGGYFFSKQYLAGEKIERRFDICLVSQWAAHFADLRKVPKEWQNLDKAIRMMTEYVARYAQENNVKVCVALRSGDPGEREFYEDYFGGACDFQISNRHTFSSYEAVSASNLIVALNSTLATEAFGVGKKVLFANLVDEEWLRPVDDVGVWYIAGPSYATFSSRVSELLEMDIGDYLNRASVARIKAYSFDPNRPAHVQIRERLLELVGSGVALN